MLNTLVNVQILAAQEKQVDQWVKQKNQTFDVISEKHQLVQKLYQQQPATLTASGLNPNCQAVTDSCTTLFNTYDNNKAPRLVIMLPSRGQMPDVGLTTFLIKLDRSLQVLNQQTLWNGDDQVHVLIGLNNKEDSDNENQDLLETISQADKEITLLTKMIKSKIRVQRLGFTWTVNQLPQNKPVIPFGAFRNYCFNHLPDQMSPNGHFISMDGDTTLSSDALKRVFEIDSTDFTTLAFQIPSHEKNAKWTSTKQAFDLHWTLQSRVNLTKLQQNLAYPAEPCLAIGSEGFQDLRALHQEGREIFGLTDCEGRFIENHLKQKGRVFTAIQKDAEVQLHNYERFEVKPHALDESRMSVKNWLSSLAGQSQSMFGQDFFTRQMAFSLGMNSTKALQITKKCICLS